MTKLIVLLCIAFGSATAFAQAPNDAARKACTEAMNADPTFAKSIVATVDKQIDERTLAAHQDAANDVAENKKHVIMAYAAMWILAALFLVFMWRRQQALKTEILQLRKDLDAAAKEPAA